MPTADTWARFLDDATMLTGGPVEPRTSPRVGDRAVRDDELAALRGYAGDLRVVLTGGAAQLAGPARFCAEHDLELSSLDTSLRDLDDPAGNARRVATAVDAAVRDGVLAEDTVVHVRLPGSPPLTASWLAAADVLAEAGLVLCLSLDAGDPEPWIDAAMDRDAEVSLVGGDVEQAVAALRTAARLWGHPDEPGRGRRFVRCWLTDDVDAALDHLASR